MDGGEEEHKSRPKGEGSNSKLASLEILGCNLGDCSTEGSSGFGSGVGAFAGGFELRGKLGICAGVGVGAGTAIWAPL